MSDPVATLPCPAQILAPNQLDVGSVEDGKVVFGNWRGPADRPEPPPPAPLAPSQRVGIAVVGLGRLTLGQILPALSTCRAARVTALVSNSPAKAAVVAAQYGISHVLDYDGIARLAELPEVQAVYIVTPNGMHLEQVQAAAAAGKHVLCEKPMANTAGEARAMIAACAAARVKLMIAYRCQFEPYNRAAIDLVRSGTLGAVRFVEATNTQAQGPADQWRMKAGMAGGGVLPDIGLYCLNGARAMTGEEPIEVFARGFSPAGDERYATVEETMGFMLRFPSGAIANCAASYGAHECKDMNLRLEKGWIGLENAFAYHGQRMRVAQRDGTMERDRRVAARSRQPVCARDRPLRRMHSEGSAPANAGRRRIAGHVVDGRDLPLRPGRHAGVVSRHPRPGRLPRQPGMKMFMLYGLAILAGLGNPLQSAANAGLNKALGNPVVAAGCIYAVAAVTVTMVAVVWEFPVGATIGKMSEVPWWGWIGGAFGVVFVFAGALATKQIGAGPFTVTTLVTAVVLSIALDHLGLMGLERHPANWQRLLGGVLAIGGVVLVGFF